MMIKKAGETALVQGYDFIATGEVLGERPMSQNRKSLDLVARMSGFDEILLRPLSARLLEPTKPEIDGLVDRERLFAIEGRSRRPQMQLAKKYGIKEYIQPAGGCLLTDPIFSKKLRRLFKMKPEANAFEIGLLKLGRQFLLPSGARLVLGRDEAENARLKAYAEGNGGGALFVSDTIPGPTAFLETSSCGQDGELAAKICASYSKHGGLAVEFNVKDAKGEFKIIASPVDKSEFERFKDQEIF
jgi:tRNA U34 2-thiouridine synthase MnmA/TrmU